MTVKEFVRNRKNIEGVSKIIKGIIKIISIFYSLSHEGVLKPMRTK